MSEIYVIFGKRGSGKSNLTKVFMEDIGGRIVYISMIEELKYSDLTIYSFDDADKLKDLQNGQIAVVKNFDHVMFSYIISNLLLYKNFTLVLDEVNHWKDHYDLEKVIDYSRHHDITIVSNTRRYVDCSRKLTSEGKIYIFKTTEPRDKEYLYSTIGEKINVEDLNEFEYYSVDDQQIYKSRLSIL